MVVCDSSTLIHLSAIGRLHLLKDLYGTLTIPAAVWREVVEEGSGRSGVAEVAVARRDGWIEILSATNEPLLRSLKHELDEGEAEVIALAIEKEANLVILDESEARRIAATFELPKTGAVGVLISARLKGKIPQLRDELDRLRGPGGFWIEETLYQKALQEVGERSQADSAAAWLKSQPPFDFEQGRRLFDYDASAPLDVKEAGTERRGDVRIVDLSYASPMGGTIPAYLILPPGEGQHPAVLFLHPGQGDRSTFVNEAVDLASRHGFVSLTISAPFLRPESKGQRGGNPWDPEVSRKEQIQTIVDVRRGFDLLVSHSEVDPRRLAYVGHSLGATVGGTLAGVDKRPLAFVLMAGFPSLTHASTDGHNQGSIAFRKLLTPEQQKAYVDALSPIDAVHYIGHAAPAKLLFQFAKNDEFITPWDAEVYMQTASEPKEAQWYDTDHSFNEAARRDREEWLTGALAPPAAP
jgi:predicted nucleic acid-binding protein/dienelactone hydrolase